LGECTLSFLKADVINMATQRGYLTTVHKTSVKGVCTYVGGESGVHGHVGVGWDYRQGVCALPMTSLPRQMDGYFACSHVTVVTTNK
jgi:hypothetical protein